MAQVPMTQHGIELLTGTWYLSSSKKIEFFSFSLRVSKYSKPNT